MTKPTRRQLMAAGLGAVGSIPVAAVPAWADKPKPDPLAFMDVLPRELQFIVHLHRIKALPLADRQRFIADTRAQISGTPERDSLNDAIERFLLKDEATE